MNRLPDRRIFSSRESAYLVWIRWSLRHHQLSYSEWAVRTPDGRRVRLAFDRRVGPPSVAEVVGR